MSNDEGMTKPKVRNSVVSSSFVIWAFIRHSSFVIRHFAAAISLLGFAWSASAAEPLEDIVEQKYTVDANATLSVTNTDGSIRVYGAEAPEIVIQAIKKAYTPDRLQGIVVDVKATSGGVAITTSFPPRKNAVSDRSGTVDYIIVVPQTARITDLKLTNGEVLIEGLRPGGSATAHLVNGWLGGHNCFADLNLVVESGRLDVAFDWWENHKFSVKAASTRGNVRAILPSDASLSLNAAAVEGRVANAFETKNTGPGDVVHSVSTVIGSDGEVAIALEAARGNIRIDKTD
jgi:hypothetical protein